MTDPQTSIYAERKFAAIRHAEAAIAVLAGLPHFDDVRDRMADIIEFGTFERPGDNSLCSNESLHRLYAFCLLLKQRDGSKV